MHSLIVGEVYSVQSYEHHHESLQCFSGSTRSLIDCKAIIRGSPRGLRAGREHHRVRDFASHSLPKG